MILCPLEWLVLRQIMAFHPIMRYIRIMFKEESLIVFGRRESVIGRIIWMGCSSRSIRKETFLTLLYNRIRGRNCMMTTSTKSSETSTPFCTPNSSLSASFCHPIGWFIHQQQDHCLPKWWNYWPIIQLVSCQLFIGRLFLLHTSTACWYSTDAIPIRNWGLRLKVSQILE